MCCCLLLHFGQEQPWPSPADLVEGDSSRFLEPGRMGARSVCSASAMSANGSPIRPAQDECKHLFPVIEHCELPSISPDVLKAILNGEQGYKADSVVIIDSRHHYEYEGGHIKGAINLSDPSSIEEYYATHLDKGKNISIIFHCEFSSARAPKMFKHMRNIDRMAHMETYPELAFPNMFLLKDGYKSFFELYPDLCEPRDYIKMLNPKYSEHLRVSASSLKKSWFQRSRAGSQISNTDDRPLTEISNVHQKAKVSRSISLPPSQ